MTGCSLPDGAWGWAAACGVSSAFQLLLLAPGTHTLGSGHLATCQMAPGKAGAWGWATGLGQAVGSGHPGLEDRWRVCPQRRMLGGKLSKPLLLTKLGFKISPGCGQKSERCGVGSP